MRKKTARHIIEWCVAVFLQTLLFVTFFPAFMHWVAALAASVSLVTALVLVFEHFYDDPSDPKNW